MHLHADAKPEESGIHDKTTGDRYVGLTVRNGATRFAVEKLEPAPGVEVGVLDRVAKESEVLKELKFVPYFFRANREGRGMMRVGLQRMVQ